MKTKFKTSSKSQKYPILENNNFLNNQNYITLWKNYGLLNYYAFNIFSNRRNTKIIRSTKRNMQEYFQKKIKEFLKVTLIFSFFYLLVFVNKLFLIFISPLIIFHIIILYSFLYFLFNKRNNNFKYYLDKKTYIIQKK